MTDTQPVLSLVIPVYNVAPYLPACLDSLLRLNPPPDEIIVVDDGSTDSCPEILASYAARLPQMRVVRQENGGLSAARNTGLALAKGKYLAFVDSDDVLAPDAYGAALAAAEADDLDLVVLNGNYHFEGRQDDYPIYTDLQDRGVQTGSEWLIERLEKRRLLHMVWLHVYRRDFLEANGFSFVPRLIHEDVLWTTRVLLLARRIRVLPHCIYHYRIPVRTFSPEQKRLRLLNIIRSSEFNARGLAKLAEESSASGRLLRALDWQLVDGAFSIFHKINQLPDRGERRQLLSLLRGNGFLGLLWRHCSTVRHRRRVLGNYLRSFLA